MASFRLALATLLLSWAVLNVSSFSAASFCSPGQNCSASTWPDIFVPRRAHALTTVSGNMEIDFDGLFSKYSSRRKSGCCGYKLTPYPETDKLFHGCKTLSIEETKPTEALGYMNHMYTFPYYLKGLQPEYAVYGLMGGLWKVNGQRISVVEEPSEKYWLMNRGLYVEGKTWMYKDWSLRVGTGESPLLSTLNFPPFSHQGTAPSDEEVVRIVTDHVDVHGLLTYAALTVINGCHDQWPSNGGNNNIWVDFAPDVVNVFGGKRIYSPWDMDSCFGKKWHIYTDGHGREGPFQKTLLNNGCFRGHYNRIIIELTDDLFSENSLTNYIRQLNEVTGHDYTPELNFMKESASRARAQAIANEPSPRSFSGYCPSTLRE